MAGGVSMSSRGRDARRGMIIRNAGPEDSSAWEAMRQAMWPSPPGEHAAEISEFFRANRGNPAAVFLALEDDGSAVGFAELSIRAFAEGCYSGRVAYLEGLYVKADARRQGVGAALVAGAEQWAKSQGCSEIASDCQIDNLESAAAHRTYGFEEVVRSICFRKTLG
jgi:aminoglycoside 6'-N-acetyltransferase I